MEGEGGKWGGRGRGGAGEHREKAKTKGGLATHGMGWGLAKREGKEGMGQVRGG